VLAATEIPLRKSRKNNRFRDRKTNKNNNVVCVKLQGRDPHLHSSKMHHSSQATSASKKTIPVLTREHCRSANRGIGKAQKGRKKPRGIGKDQKGRKNLETGHITR
jgi:hypothetical protein